MSALAAGAKKRPQKQGEKNKEKTGIAATINQEQTHADNEQTLSRIDTKVIMLIY